MNNFDETDELLPASCFREKDILLKHTLITFLHEIEGWSQINLKSSSLFFGKETLQIANGKWKKSDFFSREVSQIRLLFIF
jgi:hypothetical protein